ncbi:MAG TPA: RNA pseudouridine synthase [Dongiaceae bacterium]|jgi:tRNA pseudouridine32 synthase/23S rRNA pseudouridine746 synthase/23S rRNA pseudouridine1911/1915/1917 synthase|nr:RNA pseudouridine synthase [Dongiaceae bacterium]
MKIAERVLYRDGWILVLDKPAGVPVHAGPGGGESLESYFDALRFGLPRPPFLAHRLDRDTSGCLVLGRHKQALRKLGEVFASGSVEKTYWALTDSVPHEPRGRLEYALKKVSTKAGGWRMIVTPDGQRAITDYVVMGQDPATGRAWLALTPLTGRTHQIRVHLAALGCPVAGDRQYGQPGDSRPLHLHARSIVLPIYSEKPPVSVTAPVPPHLIDSFAACGYDETLGENGHGKSARRY